MDDLISRHAAIDVLEERRQANGYSNVALVSELNRSIGYLMDLPSAQPEIIRCKDCRWWDKYNEKHGYCMAAKHGFMSSHWEISIYRTYDEEFFCADAEPKADMRGGADERPNQQTGGD